MATLAGARQIVVAAGDRVYGVTPGEGRLVWSIVVGPQLVCADAATGEVRWRERTGEGTLVGFGRHLLWLGQSSGDLRAVRVSAGAYAEAFRTRVFTPGVVSVTGPSYADGRVFVRNLREMAAFDLQG